MEEVASELEKQVHEQTDIETGVILQDGDTIRAAQTASVMDLFNDVGYREYRAS